jgi:[ribosomal protein S5]-alanine N-acetyltransferase
MTILETARLILRPTTESDADSFIEYCCTPEYYSYISGELTPEKIHRRVTKWIASNSETPQLYYAWTILEHETNAVIGDIRFWREKNSKGMELPGVVAVGYGINPAYWGKGYMTEALKTITNFAHDALGLHRVEAVAVAENTASWKVMEKAGFTRESALRYRYYAFGKYWPLLYEYASVRPDLVKNDIAP